MNFYGTEIDSKSYHSSDDKVKLFRENIVVIEEEWFADINLTDSETFLTDLIKHAKTIFKKYINTRDTKQRIRKITIKNDCNTQII